MTPPPTVHQALAAVATDVGAVGKNREARGGDSYKYRGIEDVLNALHGPLAKHGVVIAPRVVDSWQDRDPYKLGEKGWNRTRVVVDYHVHGPAGDQLDPPLRVIGDALDNSDKGWGKAMSYAYKTALGQLFHLPTEDDNEATDIPDAGPTIDYADPELVSAIAGELRELPDAQRAAMGDWMQANAMPSLKAHRDRYPQLALNAVEQQLRIQQEAADAAAAEAQA